MRIHSQQRYGPVLLSVNGAKVGGSRLEGPCALSLSYRRACIMSLISAGVLLCCVLMNSTTLDRGEQQGAVCVIVYMWPPGVGGNGDGVKLPELPGQTSEHKVEGEHGVRSKYAHANLFDEHSPPRHITLFSTRSESERLREFIRNDTPQRGQVREPCHVVRMQVKGRNAYCSKV